MRTRSTAMLVTTALAATIVAAPLGCAALSTGDDESTDTGKAALGATCVTIRRGEAGDVHDTFLGGDYPTSAAGADSNIYIGGSSGGHENIALYGFDLGPIPAGAVITQADLHVYVSWNQEYGQIEAHRVTAPWSQATVTAASFDAAANIAPALEDTFSGYDVGWKTASLTTLVSGWVTGAIPNHGVALRESTEHHHHSYGSESSAWSRPYLVVCYDGASCGDGLQNQGESGIDCGGPCAPCSPCSGVVCAPPDQCHAAGTCDPSTGVCDHPPLADGTACDDGDVCTQSDACQAGTCAGAAVPVTSWYQDADGDGHGDPATSVQACGQPPDYIATGGDCDDTSASVKPGATEICNGHDDDCDGQIDEGACFNHGILFVADTSLTPAVIAKFDAAGNRLANYGAAQSMSNPADVMIGPDGMLWAYVGTCGGPGGPGRVLRYDPSNGTYLGTWLTVAQPSCEGHAAFGSDGNLYYVQSVGTAIKRFNGQTGAPMADLGTPPGLSNVFSLSTGPDGYLYVTGITVGSGGKILRYQTDGTYLGVFASGGDGPRRPAWDAAGNLYSAYLNDGTVRVLDGTTGALLKTLNPPSNGQVAVAFLPDGDLVVSNVWSDTIQRVRVSDGADLGSFATAVQGQAMVAW